MIKRVIFIAGVLIFLLGLKGQAADLNRVGYVDIDRVFSEYTETQKAKQELNKETTTRRKEITKLENEITTLEEELNAQELLLSKEERLKRAQEINQKILDLQKYVKDVQMDLVRKEDIITRKLFTEMTNAIKRVGEKEGYALILRKDSLLYGEEGMELTDKVIKVLNKGR